MNLISVVITTYKRSPAILLRAIDSVLKQTYSEIEIIVVDDSPTDYSRRSEVRQAVLNRQKDNIEKNIRYITHEMNLGACAARNTGINNARGKYIAFLDDDDEWLPDKLEKQLHVIQEDNVALVYCGYTQIKEETNIIEDRQMQLYSGKVFNKLLYANFIGSTSIPLINLACLRNIGGFDETLQSSQDYDVWLRIALKYQVGFVAESLVLYHIHAGEQISSNPKKKIQGLEKLNVKYQDILKAYPELWWRRYIVITPFYAQDGEVKKALAIWIQCVRKRPFKILSNLKYLYAILR